MLWARDNGLSYARCARRTCPAAFHPLQRAASRRKGVTLGGRKYAAALRAARAVARAAAACGQPLLVCISICVKVER